MRSALRNGIIAAAVLAVIGLGVNAFAGWNDGWGHRGWGHHMGPGYHHGGYGQGYYPQTSRNYGEPSGNWEKFANETEPIRDSLYEKRLALRNELAKENPDSQRAVELQKEISDLRSTLEEKRIQHMVELKKSNPEAFEGYGARGPMMGRGYGPGGGYGPGYCWR